MNGGTYLGPDSNDVWMTCPLCQNNNACATPTPSGCWCNSLDLSSAKSAIEKILQTVPEENRSGCVCKNCLINFGGKARVAKTH